MGGKNVKITIVERVLRGIAPHPCYGCGKVGVILCPHCKYDIVSEPFVGCIVCGEPQSDGVCAQHATGIARAHVVSRRDGTLEAVINALKFSRNKASARYVAELLHESLPSLPQNIKVVPIPTVKHHIRQRGYDHMDTIARHFANLRGLEVVYPLRRATHTVQHTVGREERFAQAATAFALKRDVAALSFPVLLIDDIVTTGSTLQAAAKVLRPIAGDIYVAALAYQPLD